MTHELIEIVRSRKPPRAVAAAARFFLRVQKSKAEPYRRKKGETIVFWIDFSENEDRAVAKVSALLFAQMSRKRGMKSFDNQRGRGARQQTWQMVPH
jgi:hypothetical protein